MRNYLLIVLLLVFYGGVMAQDLVIPKCRLIRVIEMPLRKKKDHPGEPKIVLLNVCLPAKARELQHPQITFEENGRNATRIYEVMRVFADRDEAEEYARANWVTDIKIGSEFLARERMADCYLIRTIDIPLTKKPNVPTESKIALLNTCPADKIPQQRPVIEVIRNGKTEHREYEVLRTFVDIEEARIFADGHGITDLVIDPS